MRKILFGLVLIGMSLFFSNTGFAGRWCCSHHGWQAYCWSNWMWQCNDGTESPSCGCGYTGPTTSYYYTPAYTPTCFYWEQLVKWVCISNEIACGKKYPWTLYDITSDKCVCENGSEYSSKEKKCVNKNQQCNQKYPWTSYQADGDRCICTNWGEYSPSTKSCVIQPTVTCSYTNWESAVVGEVEAGWQICGISWQWACATNKKWSSVLNKCILIGQAACIDVFWEYSYWDGTIKNKKYMCSCLDGYEFINNKCTLK
jgi:hypothetical protein